MKKGWLYVALSMFTVAWGGNEFTPLLVLYKQTGQFSPLFIDAMLIAYAIGVGSGLLAAGPASDRYGRRAIMLPTPIIAIIASICIAGGENIAPLMAIGRFLSGAAVGMAMTAGGAWIKELSDLGGQSSHGAKRASMALTAGFGLGAGVAGVLAQWGPIPGQLAYGLHILLSLALVPLLLTVPETRQSAHLKVKGSWLADIAVPTARDTRFLAIAAPLAPWVFGCGFTAYAILPALMSTQVTYPIAFTSLLCVLTLGVGFGIQQVAGPFGAKSAMFVTVIGMLLAAVDAVYLTVPLTLLACVFLGLSYGLCVLNGLKLVQRIAPPNDLAGLTGLYYCGTYVGMIFPALLTKLNGVFTYPQMLGFGAAVATLILLWFSTGARRVMG